VYGAPYSATPVCQRGQKQRVAVVIQAVTICCWKHLMAQQSWLDVRHVIISAGRAVGNATNMDLIHGCHLRIAVVAVFFLQCLRLSNFRTEIVTGSLLALSMLSYCEMFSVATCTNKLTFFQLPKIKITIHFRLFWSLYYILQFKTMHVVIRNDFKRSGFSAEISTMCFWIVK
jgi:hypothetical protein